VKVRLKGCAVPGAVDVEGGAEKVREPREPELKPPPTRASAEDIARTVGSASARATAMAWTTPRIRNENFMSLVLIPGMGNAPNMVSPA
jgi:hypothetical protein